MLGIGKAIGSLSVAHSDGQKLSERIIKTAELAETVSSKVRRLDEARVSLPLL